MLLQAQSRKRLRSSSSIDGSKQCSKARINKGAATSTRNLLDVLTVGEADRFYPIQRSLIQCLDIQDIISLTRTCEALASLYKRLVPTQWSIHRHLNRFVKDPLKLRETL